MSLYADMERSFNRATPITCDWCGLKYEERRYGIVCDWPGEFKLNATGAISCRDCRRKLKMAYGCGPWLYIPEVMRAAGLTNDGRILTSRILRRMCPTATPEETIQGS